MPTIRRLRTTREIAGLNPSEHTEAKDFMRMVRMHEARYPVLLNLTAIPMGGWRNKAVAGKLKGEGVRAGYPDYLLDVARGGYHGWRCELKTMTGSTSAAQKGWHERLRAEGFKVDVCRGWEEAWRSLCAYLGIKTSI